jgi:hypothetical protein
MVQDCELQFRWVLATQEANKAWEAKFDGKDPCLMVLSNGAARSVLFWLKTMTFFGSGGVQASISSPPHLLSPISSPATLHKLASIVQEADRRFGRQPLMVKQLFLGSSFWWS